MTTTDWHAPPALLARFVADPGALDDMAASSVEAHLIECADCRALVAAHGGAAAITDSWNRVADQIDQPQATLIERLLHRVGVESSLARLLGATPALRLVALATVVILAAGAALVSRSADAEGLFLVLAPLVPLVAVAVSFAPTADPAGEAGIATPLHGVGLAMRRAVAVLGVTFGVLGLAALALPDLGVTAAAWVLPALALSLTALALTTWLRAEVAVGVLGTLWLGAVWSSWWVARRGVSVADLAAFSAAGQTTALVAAVAATAVLIIRRDHLATLEAQL